MEAIMINYSKGAQPKFLSAFWPLAKVNGVNILLNLNDRYITKSLMTATVP